MTSVPALRLRHGLIAVLAIAGLTVSACSGSGNEQDKKAAQGGSKVLTVNTSFVVKSLDPGAVYEPTGNVIVHALYDTLVTFDGSDISKPVPDIAKSYTAGRTASPSRSSSTRPPSSTTARR